MQSKAFVGNKGGLGAGNAAFAGIAAGIAVAAIVGGIFLTKDKTTGECKLDDNASACADQN